VAAPWFILGLFTVLSFRLFRFLHCFPFLELPLTFLGFVICDDVGKNAPGNCFNIRILTPKSGYLFGYPDFSFSILQHHRFRQDQRVADQAVAVQLFPVQVHTGDPGAVVGPVVVDALVRVAAAGILGKFAAAVFQAAAAHWLLDGFENVEKLAEAFTFRNAGAGVQLHEGGPDEPGGAGKVSRQTCGSQPAAVGLQGQIRAEGVFRLLRGKVQKVAEPQQLLSERGIVGQYPQGIAGDSEPAFQGFDGDSLLLVCQQPVELGRGQILPEGGVGDGQFLQQRSGFGHGGALAQKPGDQLEGSNIMALRGRLAVMGIAHEIQPRHGKALLVDRIKIQGIVIHHMGHTDDGMMLRHGRPVAEGQREIPGRDGHFLGIGNVIVQGPSEVKIPCLISDSGAHIASSRGWFWK